MKTKIGSKVKLILKSGLSLAILLTIFSYISAEDLLPQLARIDPLSLVWLTLLIIMFLIIGGLNNWLIIKAIAPLSFIEVLKTFVISASVGMFTPAYVGEFASMSILLKKQGISTSDGLSVPTIDKVITLAVNILLAMAGLILYFPETDVLVYAVGFAALLIPAALLASSRVRRGAYAALSDYMPWAARYGYQCASFFVHHPTLVAANALLSIARAFVGALCVWVVILGVGIGAPLWAVVFISFVVRMVTFIPLTIQGLGLLEGTAMVLFKRIGIPPESSFLAFFIPRLAAMAIGAIVILWVIWRRRNGDAQSEISR